VKIINLKSIRREEFIEITDLVAREIDESGIKNGACVLTSLHTTGGLTINEHADPTVVKDIMHYLGKIAPHGSSYSHAEGNSDAHIKTSIIGTTLNLIIRNREPMLGTWQGIFFCEFDGPRSRKVALEIIPSQGS
jgi:secondary thiamine-phosphate synthase enzyme